MTVEDALAGHTERARMMLTGDEPMTERGPEAIAVTAAGAMDVFTRARKSALFEWGDALGRLGVGLQRAVVARHALIVLATVDAERVDKPLMDAVTFLIHDWNGVAAP